ncbi:MAG: O-antigen ligase domain-containing protein [Sphingobacteriales bacterium]|nr:MAG: O-antigen ligase domain-containing protein [Sphingobacteriales bacterium]
MLAGFFVSRAVLSLSMMLFGLNALIGVHPKEWFKNRWWLLGMLWVGIYAVSWFWSNDASYWNTRLQVKLPILLLPLAYAFIPVLNYRQLKIFTVAVLIMMLGGAAYSLSFLVSDPEFYIRGYKYSHVLPTIPENDHIRFSLTVTGSVIWAVFFYPQVRERWLKVFIILASVVCSLYLHILAARTGLLAWYLFIAGWTVYLALRRKTRKLGLSLIVFFSIATLLAFSFVPTLRERIGYFKYTLEVFGKGERTGLYSDMGRVISFDIAARLIMKNPLKGVGAGNILDSMKGGYDRWYPDVVDEQRLIPHNQFLTVGVATGIPGLLLFIAWVFYPLFLIRRNREGFFFFITWAVMLVPLMVEPVLEVQYGVFVYLFFLLWQYQAMIRRMGDNAVQTKQGHDQFRSDFSS